ncbi:MAG: flagellar protein FlaG [Helicobacter sp.]|nr:flagellar protein FlaG [Helicobacter sp.]
MNTIESGMNIASYNSNVGSSSQSVSNMGMTRNAGTAEVSSSYAFSSQIQQQELDTMAEAKDIEEQKQKLNELAQQLNREMSALNTNVSFNFNEDLNSLYVTVSEKDTNRVIRKIPSEEAMNLMAKMREIVGIIFDKQA